MFINCCVLKSMDMRPVFKEYLFILNIVLVIFAIDLSKSEEIDPNGYILYCPCMGNIT